jgi:hypothetical protein
MLPRIPRGLILCPLLGATAAPSEFLLGVRFSTPIGTILLNNVANLAVALDGRGFVYVMAGGDTQTGRPSYLAKLTGRRPIGLPGDAWDSTYPP